MSVAEPGTVISGTMRDEDVLPALLAVLEEHAPDEAAEIVASYPRTLAFLRGEGDGDEDITVDMLRDHLWDSMQDVAPPGCSFGAHEGDGADYGFWASGDD